jgi:hypothetical protein
MIRTHDLPPMVVALIDAPAAWMSVAALAVQLEKSESDVSDSLCELDIMGWLDVSDGPEGPVVTFSAKAIRLLDLDMVGDLPPFRWERRLRKRRRILDDAPPPAVERTPSRELGPAATAIFTEEMTRLVNRRAERRRARGLPLRPEDVAYPSVLLMGHALWPWSEVDTAPRPSVHCRHCHAGGKRRKVLRITCDCGRGLRRWPDPPVCPGCKDQDLSKRRSHYCLRDRRWGWDTYFSPPADQDQHGLQTA